MAVGPPSANRLIAINPNPVVVPDEMEQGSDEESKRIVSPSGEENIVPT